MVTVLTLASRSFMGLYCPADWLHLHCMQPELSSWGFCNVQVPQGTYVRTQWYHRLDVKDLAEIVLVLLAIVRGNWGQVLCQCTV